MASTPRPARVPRVPRVPLPVLLSLSCLLLASLACTQASGHGSFTHSPGEALQLSVTLYDQFSHFERPDVQVLVGFPMQGKLPPAAYANAHVTCNGRDVTPRPQDFSSAKDGSRPCTRQPPGGSYHIVYTNEHGATTSGDIPVPTGEFALRSPSEGATMPLPPSGSNHVIVIRLAVPVPAPGGSVTLQALHVVSCPPPAIVGNACPDFLGGAGVTYLPPEVQTPIVSAVTTGVTTRGGECTIPLVRFKAQPGPGSIWVSVEVIERLQQSQFWFALATFWDSAQAHFTWARAA